MPKVKDFISEKLEGATFSLAVVGRAVRHRIELGLAEQRHQQRVLMDQYRAVAVNSSTKTFKKDGELTTEDRHQIDRINIQAGLLDDEVQMAFAKKLLVKFAIPGEEYADVKTVDDLFEFGPELLCEEIVNKSTEISRLPAEERKNSEPPTSSQPAEDGRTSDSTATTAKSSDSTEPETAK